LRDENAILAILLVVIVAVVAILSKGISISQKNVTNVLLQSSVNGIAALGQAFVILTAGIDLSVGGAAIWASVVGARMITGNPEFLALSTPAPLGLAVIVMLLLGLGIGAVNGLSVSRIGMPALIVTLAMWQITRGGAYMMSGGARISSMPDSLAFFGQGVIAGVPVPVIIFIVVAAVAYYILYHTTFGRSIYAVGGNPTSAYLSGIKVRNIYMGVYLISGFLAALTGIVLMSRAMSGSMGIRTGLELDTISSVIIGGVSIFGGRGTLIGVVLGVIIYGAINNGMNLTAVNPHLQQLIRGGILFLAVAVDIIRRR
jgi:ribose/xylose/arabinose/galactoside ABC-type transport system permease subunit